MASIEKRKRETELSDLHEPEMSALDWEDFERGIVLFNDEQFWESHEAWEEVWQRHPENSRIFFQGLIQVAAGFHQLGRQIYHGAEKHFKNALWKLKPFPPVFLRIEVESLIAQVEMGLVEIQRLGENNLGEFDQNLIAKIQKQR